MTAPVTLLKTEFSDPNATPTEWAETQRALEAAELFWVSTVRRDGRPHVTPVVGVWAEGALWFSTGETEQKFVNMRANPRVVLTTGCNGWEGGLDVVVEGEAEHVTDDDTLVRIAAVFASRWDGRWQFAVGDGMFKDPSGSGGAMVLRVKPLKVFAHSKGDPFAETRYRFE